MRLTLEQLKQAASDLPGTERVELAYFLMGTLGDYQAAEVRAEELALAERRMADVKAGKVVGKPAEDVLKSRRSAEL